MAISPHNKSDERGHRPSRGRDGIKGLSVGVQTKTGVGTWSVHSFHLVISILAYSHVVLIDFDMIIIQLMVGSISFITGSADLIRNKTGVSLVHLFISRPSHFQDSACQIQSPESI